MDYLFKDLGYVAAGSLVVVTLNSQANVQLMTTSEYNNYRAGRQHTYYGGRAVRSPVRLSVPHTGNWVVAIDLGGHGGRLSASVRVDTSV